MAKSKKIREVLKKTELVTVRPDDTISTAARKMKEKDVGNVLVAGADDKIVGILTDRDIVVRAIADELEPMTTAVDRICSKALATLGPDDEVEHAVELMRKKAIRRVPVVENDKAIGILSIGDLALERDPKSALAGISGASPNE